jgi:hypothetical protein
MTELFDQDKFYVLSVIDEDDGAQTLVEVFPDGQVHVARRKSTTDTWSVGSWGIAKEVPFK